MPEFIYLIRPVRREFFKKSTPQEDAAMAAHFTYLKQAVADGVVLLAGPCLDETFGVVVLSAESETAAHTFMQNDPSVKNNVMVAKLHPMKVSLMSRG